ncbi:uncharacterized protein LOC119671744 [Teleopsis dalmanni]|uniref:uncharacterized protein LOC119671744 n=1 Tax=Teleopsis dalmanni TaxID=139649 RepID=UPI0018CD9783|nr:uncharacterized protein LOC119671744 [Teleopsis dalmanni]
MAATEEPPKTITIEVPSEPPVNPTEKLLKWYRKKLEICPRVDNDIETSPSYTAIVVQALLDETPSEMKDKAKLEEIFQMLFDTECKVEDVIVEEVKEIKKEPEPLLKIGNLSSYFRKIKTTNILARNRFSVKYDHQKRTSIVQKKPEEELELWDLEADPIICERIFDDDRDVSRQPSFTKFVLPYSLICQMRIAKKRREFERQFQYEIKQLLRYNQSALETAMFHSHMAYTTMWPPLHNRREIEKTSQMFELSKAEQKRLNYLMNNEIT